MKRFLLALMAAAVPVGCTQEPAAHAPATTAEAREDLRSAIEAAEREADSSVAPVPVIDLPQLPGWEISEPRSLPAEDYGYSVAYQHESGLTVTLYQFTRGIASIPHDVDAPVVHEQIDGAKAAIQQAVEMGYWSSARELKSEIVRLGDSQQQALWSQFELTVDGETAMSEIYVWTRNNAFFKLRSTSRAGEEVAGGPALLALLTALGDAKSATP